jgi:hypothetical protein
MHAARFWKQSESRRAAPLVDRRFLDGMTPMGGLPDAER